MKAVDAGLRLASRYSPERDLAELIIFNEAGRIRVGQMTYRNVFAIGADGVDVTGVQRVSLQAQRPFPLIDSGIIDAFEALVAGKMCKKERFRRF